MNSGSITHGNGASSATDDDLVRFCKFTVTNGYKFGIALRYKISEISSVSASVASSGRCVELPPDGIRSLESSEIMLDVDWAGVKGLDISERLGGGSVVVVVVYLVVILEDSAAVDGADAIMDGVVVDLVVDQADGGVVDDINCGM